MAYIFIFRHLGIQSLNSGHFIELLIVTIMSWLTIPLAIKYIPYFVAQKDLISIK
jgi:hypothetical protein